ncbi:DUF3718 domain-containing protein [Endozoicomonas sp. G2_1]|uniref:DUF3718 domain-containing protein n=1 Tax=Endozoicomonas sp. G2_1 TaxID=2821091 RepID=UPI001ADC4F3A|nr:DUF3718 domain-containing protein [Endozoicomonas sp. G2_1]MBO9491910.1 DUF3718 domain-containing protein [Endozoicomonas sp. G2_1]
MKKFHAALTFALLSVSTIAPAAQAADSAQAICEYVAVDDKKRLRTYLKSNKLKIRSIFDGVKCNGQNLLAFAASRSAVKTGTLMINKLPKKKVESLLSTITADELTTAAQKRINS